MLVECPFCRFGYHAGARRCPKCQSYETPITARRVVVANEAAARIESGDTVDEIREWLLAEGFADFDAEAIIQSQLASQKSTARSLGVGRFATGSILLIGGAVVVGIGLLIPVDASQAMRRVRWIILWSGAIPTTLGAAALISGLAGMLFGKNLAFTGLELRRSNDAD